MPLTRAQKNIRDNTVKYPDSGQYTEPQGDNLAPGACSYEWQQQAVVRYADELEAAVKLTGCKQVGKWINKHFQERVLDRLIERGYSVEFSPNVTIISRATTEVL